MASSKEKPNNFDHSSSEKETANISEKYFSDLEKWLHDAYLWQGVAASFPYFFMCDQFNLHSTGVDYGSLSNPLYTNGGLSQQASRLLFANGIECKVPALWKRLLAEFLDFLILFILKLAVTWVAIDVFEIIDPGNLDFDGIQLDMRKMDYKVALQMTRSIMVVEILNRIVVCTYETFWLIGGVAGRIGGATPGKAMMGLRVVRCETVTSLSENDDSVVVYPGTDLGLGWSFARSFIKNMVLALFIPFIVAFYYFPFSRAGYDMICNTIVIEEPILPHRPHQQ